MKDMKALLNEWRTYEQKVILEQSAQEKVASMLADPSTQLSQYVAVLKKYASDPEFRKIAAAGQNDGQPGDEKVSVERTQTAAGKLTATQAEIGFGNSLADQMTNKYNSTSTALGEQGEPIIMPSPDNPPPAVLVWNGKYILDGHHRWSQVAMTNPAGILAIDNVTGPNLDSEADALKAMQLAIAATAGKVVTKPFEGQDLMKSSPDQVGQYVRENISDEVLQMLVKNGKLEKPDKELAAQYYAGNLNAIKKKKGKFSREKSMPQAGKSGVSQGKVNKTLATGAINYNDPKASDAKG